MRALLLIVSLSLCGLCLAATTATNPKQHSNYHYYQLVTPDSPVTFAQAAAIANTMWLINQPAYLVTITDQAEHQFIYTNYLNTAATNGKPNPVSWTGARRNTTTGLWMWYATSVGRSSAAFWNQTSTARVCQNGLYCNWASTSEPSTAGICMQTHFTGSTAATGLWTAKDCNALSSAFVIEYDAPNKICAAGYTYQATPYPQCVAIICSPGYNFSTTPAPAGCKDVDECLSSGTCPSGYTCVNTPGSFQCNDNDECLSPSACPAGHTCANTPGSFTCTDNNECESATACPSGYTCSNIVGSFSCDDINECAGTTSPCPADKRCENSPAGSYSCVDNSWSRIKSGLKTDEEDFYLDLEDGSTAPGTKVIISSLLERDTQYWRVENGYIINKANGFVVDIKDDQIAPTQPIIAWYKKPSEASANQVWTFDTTGSAVVCHSNPNFALDVDGAHAISGTHVILWWLKSADLGTDNQYWEVL